MWLSLLLLPLGGCRALGANACHAPQPYASAKSVAPLRIPPGLDSPAQRAGPAAAQGQGAMPR
jgi:hypothetical protein